MTKYKIKDLCFELTDVYRYTCLTNDHEYNIIVEDVFILEIRSHEDGSLVEQNRFESFDFAYHSANKFYKKHFKDTYLTKYLTVDDPYSYEVE